MKNFRDFVVQKKMLVSPRSTLCMEPDRLADKLWTDVNSQDFACKPSVEVDQPVVSNILPHLLVTVINMLRGAKEERL